MLKVGPYTLYPYQERIVHQLRQKIRDLKAASKPPHILLQAPCGSGKCLGRGTPVLMLDGSTKLVEDIVPGDKLIGPDSQSRTVLTTSTGIGQLFRVVPVKGRPYVVNGEHILSVRPYGKNNRFGNQPINVSVNEWLSAVKDFRVNCKGWRSAVEWPEKAVPLDPYFLGLWLGDGSTDCPSICTPDGEIKDFLTVFARQHGLFAKNHRPGRTDASQIGITTGTMLGPKDRNHLMATMRSMRLIGNKHIPMDYMANSRKIRLELLAGLLDTDGYFDARKDGYEITSKFQCLADDIAFLARSVGLAAYVKPAIKTCQTGASGTYYRQWISGDCSIIPCRVSRKKAPYRKPQKNVLNVGIRVDRIGEGEYFGFEIDGDGLFLLADFTVTHNSTLSAFLSQSTSDHGNKFLFMVAGRSLVAQMSAKLAECEVHHGILMADSDRAITHEYASHNQKTMEYCPIIIASRDTYDSRVLNRQTVHDFKVQVILIDEADNGHRGKVYQKLIKDNPDIPIIGTTATPARANGCGLGDLYQDIVMGVSHKELLDGGFIVPPIYFGVRSVDMTGVKISRTTGDYVQEEAAARFDKEELIGDLIRDWRLYAQQRPTVVFAQSVAHSQHCAHMMTACGIPSEHMDADTPLAERQKFFRALETGELLAICNYGVFSRGVDVPAVGCCVVARAMCSLPVFLQCLGRVWRSCKNAYWAPGGIKKDCVVIDHGGNMDLHGWPQKDRPWPLDPGRTVDDEALDQPPDDKPRDPPLCHCPKCGGEWPPRSGYSGCPHCGHERFSLGLEPRFDGQRLTRLREERNKPPKNMDQAIWMSVLARSAYNNRSYGSAVKLFEKETGKTFSSVNVSPTLPYEDRKRNVGEVWPNFLRGRRSKKAS